MAKIIRLVVPNPEFDPGDRPIKTLFISPEGADPDREVPGFFTIQIDGKYISNHLTMHPPITDPLPRQFLSLDAVHSYLRERYGWTVPLHVTTYAKIQSGARRDFPAIWGATRKIDKKRVEVRVRYLGSFYYWNGRRVDPTTVGTQHELN